MKKIVIIGVLAAVVAGSGYFLASGLRAEPVVDYTQVSPTVKISAYRLSRNGDIYSPLGASATIISPKGLLLTNSHAVLDEEDKPYEVFSVCLSFSASKEPSCEYSAFLRAYDKKLDLALLEMVGADNRGNQLSALPYLPYDFAGTLESGMTLDVLGYPDIGGKNLTTTSGQVAGFEDVNGLSYLKTDTDISSGNSGGTALNEEGQFVGVPTYIMSGVENIGYVLEIKQAQNFIAANLAKEPIINQTAYEQLKVKMNLFNDAQDKHALNYPYYPNFSLSTGEDWEWLAISRTEVSLLNRSNDGNKLIRIAIYEAPFKVPQAYLDEVSRQFNLLGDDLTGFQKQASEFHGYPATLVSFNISGQKFYSYLIPYGKALVTISYWLDLEKMAEDSAAVGEVLGTFKFLQQPDNQPVQIKEFINQDPPFSIRQIGNWQIQKNLDPENEDLILELGNPENIDGDMSVSYYKISKDFRELNNQQRLDNYLKDNQGYNFNLVNKSAEVVIDGLAGWSVTYTHKGDEAQQVKKTSEIYLRDGDYSYKIVYEDLLENYEKYLPDFTGFLRNFKNYRQAANQAGKGKYNLATLEYNALSDITHHRFEQSITDLVDQKVMAGYNDNTFRPEARISGNEVKKYLTTSFAVSKREKTNPRGLDSLTGIEVSLGEALKAMTQSYQLNVWQNSRNDAPEGKVYLDLGYQLGLIPEGLTDYNYKITRAEFAYLLQQLLESFEN